MSKILEIVTNPNPLLRKKSVKIRGSEIDSNACRELYRQMSRTMIARDGVGLAAPQIGKNIRLITINTKNGVLCMINPEIIKKSWKKCWDEEGCISVPNTYGQVRRHYKVSCIYLNKNSQKQKIEAEGLLARIIQHEIDHLDGILFIDKAKDIKKITKM